MSHSVYMILCIELQHYTSRCLKYERLFFSNSFQLFVVQRSVYMHQYESTDLVMESILWYCNKIDENALFVQTVSLHVLLLYIIARALTS